LKLGWISTRAEVSGDYPFDTPLAGPSHRHDSPHDGVGHQQDEQGLDEEPAFHADLPYLLHRLLAYHAPAVRAGAVAAAYGATGMVQLTGAVTKMRKASYLFSSPMLEMSGLSGK